MVEFYYGTMHSGKTLDALRTAFSFESKGLEIICLSSALDTRSGNVYKDAQGFLKGKWKSRIGLWRETYAITPETKILQLIKDLEQKKVVDRNKLYAILIDEAQFLMPEQVEELFEIAHFWKVRVLCYGLLTTFKTTLFEGSKRLIELGAKMHEIPNITENGERATFNAKLINGEIVLEGEDIEVGDKQYVPMTFVDYYIAKRKEKKHGIDRKSKRSSRSTGE